MLRTSPRNLLWIIPLALLVTSPVWQPAAKDFLAPHGHIRGEAGAAPPDKSFILTDVQLSRYENGQPDLELKAARVESGRRGMDSFRLQNIDATLFANGRERAHITGGEGFYDDGSQILTLVEDAAVVAKNRYELRADALRYLIAYKTVKTAADIFFTSRGFTVRGTGMSYNLATGAYRVGGRVVCDVK